MRGKREHGFALASVLWGMAALSLIAAAMLNSSMNAVHVARNAWDAARVRNAADNAVEAAVLSLFDPVPGSRPAVDGTSVTTASADADVTVAIQDERGRIDANYARRDFLQGVLRGAGADEMTAETLADRIVDWRSPTGAKGLNGATRDEYRRAGGTIMPRGAPFQSVDEVGLVMGMTPELFARLEPALTVYSHHSDFDMRVAPPAALFAIPGMDADAVARTIAARHAATKGSTGFGDPNLTGHAFTIDATAVRGNVRATRHAVILLTADRARPVWVLDWR